VRDARHEQLDWLIGVDSAERVLGETDRQRGALERARSSRVLRRRPAAPYVAGAFTERDKHAHGGHGVEHGKGITLGLIKREFLILRARRDGEAGLGGRAEVFFVLRDGVVERSPYEHLQFRKVLLDDEQYALILTRGLHLGDKLMR
jgi:hypothetical protein